MRSKKILLLFVLITNQALSFSYAQCRLIPSKETAEMYQTETYREPAIQVKTADGTYSCSMGMLKVTAKEQPKTTGYAITLTVVSPIKNQHLLSGLMLIDEKEKDLYFTDIDGEGAEPIKGSVGTEYSSVKYVVYLTDTEFENLKSFKPRAILLGDKRRKDKGVGGLMLNPDMLIDQIRCLER